MWIPSVSCMFWLTIVVQLVGVATIGALHLLPHGRRRNICQRVFFASLLAMGCVTLMAVVRRVTRGCRLGRLCRL